MTDTYDYLDWWNDLEDIWKDLLKSEIKIKMACISLKKIMDWDKLTGEEIILTKYKDNFEKNTKEIKTEAIKYISKDKKATIGRQYSFELRNLDPLKIFVNTEEIQFINATIKNIEALNHLPQLKLINFTRSQVNNQQIEDFKRTNPECKVLL